MLEDIGLYLRQKEGVQTFLGLWSCKKQSLRDQTFPHYLSGANIRGQEELLQKNKHHLRKQMLEDYTTMQKKSRPHARHRIKSCLTKHGI